MSIRRLLESLPKRQHDAGKDFNTECRIRARKLHSRSNGHFMIEFKRIGTGRNKSPCCMSNCSCCGIFWRIYVEDLERAVPGLVVEQLRPPRSRKQSNAFKAPSTPVSTVSTLTEFTEDLEQFSIPPLLATDSELPTPSSILSSFADLVSQHDVTNTSSCASSISTLTAFIEDNFACRSLFPQLTTSLSTLTDFDQISNPFSISNSAVSSISTLTDFSELDASSISTLTDFTELDTTSTLSSPPSSLSPPPSSLSTTTIIPTSPQAVLKHLPRNHKNMIGMSDGSEWLPPTLERVQAYISSQGSHRLARSARSVVAQKAGGGSKVARGYERDILKVDSKIAKKSGQ